MGYIDLYLAKAVQVIEGLGCHAIDEMVQLFVEACAQGGRLSVLGVGGSAANASHAVNDFRKFAGMDAYMPVDNVAEFTARINDEGWDTVYSEWLACSQLNDKDLVFVLSVGGAAASRISAQISYRHCNTPARSGPEFMVSRDGTEVLPPRSPMTA